MSTSSQKGTGCLYNCGRETPAHSPSSTPCHTPSASEVDLDDREYYYPGVGYQYPHGFRGWFALRHPLTAEQEARIGELMAVKKWKEQENYSVVSDWFDSFGSEYFRAWSRTVKRRRRAWRALRRARLDVQQEEEAVGHVGVGVREDELEPMVFDEEESMDQEPSLDYSNDRGTDCSDNTQQQEERLFVATVYAKLRDVSRDEVDRMSIDGEVVIDDDERTEALSRVWRGLRPVSPLREVGGGVDEDGGGRGEGQEVLDEEVGEEEEEEEKEKKEEGEEEVKDEEDKDEEEVEEEAGDGDEEENDQDGDQEEEDGKEVSEETGEAEESEEEKVDEEVEEETEEIVDETEEVTEEEAEDVEGEHEGVGEDGEEVEDNEDDDNDNDDEEDDRMDICSERAMNDSGDDDEDGVMMD